MTIAAKPKITDVARLAGVSTATVSRALSKPDRVTDKTRERVVDAARLCGYRINLAARNLRQNRTNSVVVLVPNIGNPFFSTILAGIEEVLSKNNLNVVIVDTAQHSAKPELIFDYLHNSRADGIICLDGSIPGHILESSLATGFSPPVVFACEWRPSKAFSSVSSDNTQGARLAVRYLHELGHVAIGHVKGPQGNILTSERLHGFELEIDALGLSCEPDWIFEGDFSLSGGAQAGLNWLGLSDRPSAVFCASDETAFGFISQLHNAGVRVPQEVSVIGFDDIDIAEKYIPPLTTIRQKRKQLGMSSASKLLGEIGEDAEQRTIDHTVLPVELVKRQSAAPVNPAPKQQV